MIPAKAFPMPWLHLFFVSDSSYEVQKGDDDDDAFPNYKEGLGSSEWTKVVIRVPKLRKILI